MAVKNTLINSVQIVLMSTGVIFIAILVSLSLPQLFASAPNLDLSSLWSGVQAWLRPPYLYFIINGIIITIAASSFLHRQQTPTSKLPHQHEVIAVSLIPEVVNGAGSYYGVVSVEDVVSSSERVEVEKPKEEVIKNRIPKVADLEVVGDGQSVRKSTVVERFTWTPAMTPPLARQKAYVDISPDILSEKPAASSRFGHHRRPAKATSAEGGKLLRRVAKSKKKDTLETTWKTITEGRHMPLTRHLKKSDTWEKPVRQINLLDDDSFPERVKKSETFKEGTNHTPPPVPKLKKEPSLSHDDLNRRVEAFINKFNEEIRLQRQQSMQQFMDKINRAAY